MCTWFICGKVFQSTFCYYYCHLNCNISGIIFFVTYRHCGQTNNNEAAGNRIPGDVSKQGQQQFACFVHQMAGFHCSTVNRNDMVSPWVHTFLRGAIRLSSSRNLTFTWERNGTVELQRVGLLFTQEGNMKRDVRILLLGERKSLTLAGAREPKTSKQ